MKLIIRHTLFGIFVLVFFIAAPVIIFYASGYRYNLAKQKIEQTGHLLVTSKPSGADVKIDGKAYDQWWRALLHLSPSVTPARIKNLLSGEYTIDLSLDGYWPWRRKAVVLPQQTTFATDVALLIKKDPVSVVTVKDLVTYHPLSAQRAAYITPHSLVVFDQGGNTSQTLWSTTELIQDFKLVTSPVSYLVTTDKAFWLIQDGKSPAQLARRPNISAISEQQGRLIGLAKTGLVDLNINGKQATEYSVNGTLIDILLQNTGAYYLVTDGGGSALYRRTLSRNTPAELILKLPVHGLSFLPDSTDRYVVLRGGEGLTVIDVTARSPHATIVPYAHDLRWIAADDALVWGDFEVSRYHFLGDHYDQMLIAREGGLIHGLALFAKLPYTFIVRAGEGISAWELEVPDNERNVYTVVSGGKDLITNMQSMIDTKTLWYRRNDTLYQVQVGE